MLRKGDSYTQMNNYQKDMCIAQIVKALEHIEARGMLLNYEALVCEIMKSQKITRRTAKLWIKEAKVHCS